MIRSPKISVVMSVYNHGAFVGDAIRSVLDQGFRDYEFLIVDDASTDETMDVVQRWALADDRIKVMRNETRLGLTKSLNRAVSHAAASWVARQDADDLSHTARFQSQMGRLEKNPEVGILGTWYEGIDKTGHTLYKMILPEENNEIKQWLATVNCLCHGSVLFSKDAFMRAGGYPERYLFAQDYALWLRLSSLVPMANLPEVLYYKRIHRCSVSQSRLERWEVLRQIKSDSGLLDESISLKDFIAAEHREHSRFLKAMGYNKMSLMSWIKGGYYQYQPAFLWKQMENKIRNGI